MECRKKCGACCIAPSISSPIPGMPEGKPANVRCIQLNENFECKIFNQQDRPQVCADFLPNEDICGSNQSEALKTLGFLEVETVFKPKT